MRYSDKATEQRYLNVEDIYLLLKTLLRIKVVNMVKSFIIRQRNLSEMYLILSKTVIPKTVEATGDLLGVKL